MAMLAEPRRKQKWSLNPRGKEWSEDSNKFGQKMLEKMGWSSGKGLGANLSGITEHIKVSYKLDSKGVGFKDRGDQWTEHEDNFSALLNQLGGSDQNKTDATKQRKSLEEKSCKSRARVHYHKFTRGKDLTRYSEKDLANIFGRKKLEKEKVTAEVVDKCDDSEDARYGVETIKGGSMVDYFKRKLPSLKFGGGGFSVGNNGVLKQDSDSESELNVTSGFGFGFKQDKKRKISSDDEDIHMKKKLKVDEDCESSNNKVKKETFVSYLNGNKENVVTHEVVGKKKKKKSKKSDDDGLENPCFSEGVDEESEVIATENPYEVIMPVQKKKKKKIKCDLVENQSNEVTPLNKKNKKISESVIVEESGCSQTVMTKKKKKSDVIEIEFAAENILVTGSDGITTQKNKSAEIVEDSNKVSSKKKKSADIVEEIVCKNNKSTENMEDSKQVTPKKKKSAINVEEIVTEVNDSARKKKKSAEIEVETHEFISNSKIIMENGGATPKKKKSAIIMDVTEISSKKKKSTAIVDKFAFENNNCTENEVDIKQVKKKKSASIVEEPNQFSSKNNKFTANVGDTNDIVQKKKKFVDETEGVTSKKKKKRNAVEQATEVQPKKKKSRDNTSSEDEKTEEIPVNPYEVTVPKKKKKKSKKVKSDEETHVTESTGMDNPALNLTDMESSLLISDDLVLNVISKPVVTTPIIKRSNPPQRRKSVRFSDVNQERIIPSNAELRLMSQEDTENRNELLSINAKVIENGLEEQRKRARTDKGFINNGFDIKTVDNVSFYESEMELAKPGKNLGVVNVGFKNVQENVERIDACIDDIQAEVENDFNEAKSLGETGGFVSQDERVDEGVRLSYKNAKFNISPYARRNTTGPRASYAHLIRGDVILQFKDANLHEVDGYAYKKTGKRS